ncbi:acyl-protein thioesterase 2 [Arabidopsis lyrata subsp. lyrata]|uniref:acyl-protein thioesterase 2 n=1 Tax=Arabidopsis lyrata subsp. lyrata TaxID=81972 RepID=UPI000A29B4A5|nr:acyl-protein thioesterase 2 [Arabidopsis lyrata subsp. lyrata]|eukprot:XP_020866654.1 acyl-protein thioesterase 2 [Arabidopsis lyrata subsp. lyrata]
MASSSGNIKFGKTYFVRPTGVHKATIIWLHDVESTGYYSHTALGRLKHPNIKWICPTAPKRPVTSLGGEVTTAWCDMTKASENMLDDYENLNYVNEYITRIFSSEPQNVMKGLGGVGLGAAQALYYTSCYAFGWVPISPQIVIGINGWLPGWRSLEYNMCNTNFGTANRAATSRILLMHGTSDDVIPSAFGYKCADSLRMSGFPTLFKQCGGDHVMNEIRIWLGNLGL